MLMTKPKLKIVNYEGTKALIEVNETWCKGCRICVDYCPEDVLAMNRVGKVIVANIEACTICNWCNLRCPDFAIIPSKK
jgi:2-oxoglutarate ferredoxin oxidoreductase subunit delta